MRPNPLIFARAARSARFGGCFSRKLSVPLPSGEYVWAGWESNPLPAACKCAVIMFSQYLRKELNLRTGPPESWFLYILPPSGRDKTLQNHPEASPPLWLRGGAKYVATRGRFWPRNRGRGMRSRKRQHLTERLREQVRNVERYPAPRRRQVLKEARRLHEDLLRRLEEDIEELRWWYDPEVQLARRRDRDRFSFPHMAASILPKGPAKPWLRPTHVRAMSERAKSWAKDLTRMAHQSAKLAEEIDEAGSMAFGAR